MRIIRANGVRLHAVVQGPEDGVPVVLVNSLGTDLRVWDRVVPLLPAGLRLLRWDKRGHGLSEATPAPYAMEALADDLAGLMDGLGFERAVIVGLSIGGLIALALAARRPDLVAGIVLMDTAHRIGTAETWNARIAAIRAGGLESIGDAVMERWFSPGFRKERPDEVAGWRTMLVRTPAEGYSGACAAIRDADYEATARTLAVPVLAMAGTADLSTPPEVVRATAAIIPGARFETVEGVGHLPPVEAPERTAALIAELVAAAAKG